MDKRAKIGINKLGIIVATALALELMIITTCSKHGAAAQAQRISPPPGARLRLNLEEMGTTNDTSDWKGSYCSFLRSGGAGYRNGQTGKPGK